MKAIVAPLLLAMALAGCGPGEHDTLELLGRKGTRSMDRLIGLAVWAAGSLTAERPAERGDRCGLVLGQLLFDNDVPAYDGSESWIEGLLKKPGHHAALTAEVRAVAQEIADDPKYAGDEPLGPDDAARARFRAFARAQLEQT